jgi:peptide/nickel transport system ATP-binding protein
MTILDIQNLNVKIPTFDGIIHAVQDVSFTVEKGELFGIAGESGSGKSVLTQSIMGLLPKAKVEGEVWFDGQNLLALPKNGMRNLRGSQIGMIFQDPLSSLHPYYTIGSQITEMIHCRSRVTKEAARRQAVEMLERVGIPNADARFDAFPHQFSGGMRQRVMIAMALILRPQLVIADEPTTALDVTVQAQIIDLLDEMRRELGTTVIMITHDLELLSSVADHIMVMYAGNRMEFAKSAALFSNPAHPYTTGLLRSSPSNYEAGSELLPIPGKPPSLLLLPKGCAFAERCVDATERCFNQRPPLRLFSDETQSLCWQEKPSQTTIPARAQAGKADAAAASHRDHLVIAKGISLHFPGHGLFTDKGGFDVLKGVDLEIRKGETVGLVGESGCGKSTLARVIAGLIHATTGSVSIDGKNVEDLTHMEWRELRKQVQLVFQDPFGSLNPKRRVGAIIGDPFRIHRIASGNARKAKVQGLMEMVGLNPEHYNRFPSEFSGGQRQRIGIARALALNPSLIIFDEPVSALDVSIQAQVLNLIASLQKKLNLTYLFISHDLSVVRHVSQRIAVMSKGVIVEMADAETLFTAPQHAYTKTLLAASAHRQDFPAAEPRRLIAHAEELSHG